jgi:hypothetical protein
MICPEHFVVMINPDEFDYGPSPRGFVAKIALFLPLIALRPPKLTKLPLLKFGTQDPNVHNFGMQDPKISFNFFLCVLEPNIHTHCLFWNARSEIGFYFFSIYFGVALNFGKQIPKCFFIFQLQLVVLS